MKIFEFSNKLTSPRTYESDYVCVVNENGQRVCYNNIAPNQVICNQNNCQINITTTNHEILKFALPKGIWYNFKEQGNISNIQAIGIFPKEKLKEITDIFPNIPINETNDIIEPHFGKQSKSVMKKLFPFLDKKKNK
jgi:hypothetical protein